MVSSKKTGTDAIVSNYWPRLSQEGRTLHERARALAEQCAANAPLDYKLELTLFCEYPDGFDELLDACGEKDAGQRYSELFEETKKERSERAFAFDSVVGERLAAQICDASVLHYAEEVKTVLLVDILPNAQDFQPALSLYRRGRDAPWTRRGCRADLDCSCRWVSPGRGLYRRALAHLPEL